MLTTVRFFDNQKYNEFRFKTFFHFRQSLEPEYLKNRHQRSLDEHYIGGAMSDDDYNQLEEVREVTKTLHKKIN